MRKYYSVPLIFFALAAGLGLFLRWQFIEPTPGVRFTWFLHSHSHVMFLGWVFNVLYLAFVDRHISRDHHPRFKILFVVMQIFVLAMMISFPLQGYGTWSITFSTLHTIGGFAFILMFFRLKSKEKTASLWFARVSLIFFLISTAGPFSLGYLMANGLGQTVWYNFSIYYYLHFQYNGFFLFGVFSLFFQLLEEKKIPFNSIKSKFFGKLMAIACIPAYTLSILFAKPDDLYYVVAAVAGLLQIVALIVLVEVLRPARSHIKQSFQGTSYNLLNVIFFALALKLFLQLTSAHPHVAQLAYELRPIVIAYLHLVLVGVITLFILCWYLENKLMVSARLPVNMLLIGFIGSEICLVVAPWWTIITGNPISSSTAIFIFSILMLAAACFFCLAYKWKNDDMSLPSNAT